MKKRGNHKIGKSSSIGKRIETLVAKSVFAAILLLSLVITLVQLSQSIETTKSNAMAAAYVIASASADAVSRSDQHAAVAVLSSASRIPGALVVAAADINGKLIASLGNSVVPASELSNNSDGLFQALMRGSLPVSVDIVKGGKSVGRIFMLADVAQHRSRALFTLLAISMAAMIAALLGIAVARPIQRSITEPLRQLISSMTNIRDTQNFEVRVNSESQDETGVLAQTFNAMIGDIQSRDQELQKIAFLDTLTGLPNRASFHRRIEKMSEKKETAALFNLNVEKFHEINSSLGHILGDSVLRETANLLQREVLILGNSEVYRLGGDEFVIVANGIASEDAAIRTYARFLSLFYKPLKISGHDININFTTSAVVLQGADDDVSTIYRNMDIASTEANEHRGNQITFFKEAMNEKVRTRTDLIAGLRDSIERGDIDVHYQIVTNFKSGKVKSFEALARWTHPTKGFISPAVFVPLAEQAGLVHDLGMIVLRKSCMQAKKWFDETGTLRQVSVNISAAQLIQADFIHDIEDALTESRLPPPLLCLELTESVFIGRSSDKIRSILLAVKALGVQLSLDDFGTGYSSLSYLEALPFDVLKTDRAFLLGVQKSEKKMMLLKNIIQLAHDINLEVVSEGAETQEDLQVLKKLGADYVQGYVMAKPMPADLALARANEIDTKADAWAKTLAA